MMNKRNKNNVTINTKQEMVADTGYIKSQTINGILCYIWYIHGSVFAIKLDGSELVAELDEEGNIIHLL